MRQDQLNKQLLVAVRENNIQKVKKFLNDGANINARDEYGFTPLHEAALCGCTETAKLLIEKDADINTKDNVGRTPLRVAAMQGWTEIVGFLKQHGAVE